MLIISHHFTKNQQSSPNTHTKHQIIIKNQEKPKKIQCELKFIKQSTQPMLRLLIARTRLLALKPTLSILTRFSTEKQQKAQKTFIEQISTSTSLLQLLEQVKKREADQQNIAQIEIVEAIKLVNRIVTQPGLEERNQAFIEYCRILQKNLHKVQACVSLQQLVELREILYGIKLVQQSLVVEKMYPMLTKNFQLTFRQLQSNIRCEATGKSIQNYLKYLIAYYSDFYYIDYKLYRVLSQTIYNNLKKITKSQLLSLDPHVILLTIHIYARRFQLSLSEKNLVDQLISVLALFDDNELLTSLHHVMLYLYYQGTGLKSVSVNSKKFTTINKQKVTKLLSQNNLKQIPHNCLNFFLKHSPSHKYQQFEKFLQMLTNKMIESEDMEMINYTTFLKLLKSAFRSREYLIKRIKLQNMQKLELIIKKYLQDRQESCNTFNANQDSLHQLYSLLEIGVLDSFLEGLLPQLVVNNIIVNSPKFIYMLATKGIFHYKFIAHLEKNKPVANEFLNGDLGSKVASMQRIIAVKLYSQNKDMKLSKELLQTLEQLINFFHKFKAVSQFSKFQYGLNCKFTLLFHFHRAFGHIYFQALTEIICDVRNVQGKDNSISIFQYAISACPVDEFIKLCSSTHHIFDLVLLTKLLWHFQITFYKQHALLNLLAFLYSFSHLYKDKNANQTSMNQICIFISRTDRAHTFAKLNSFWLMQIFERMCSTAYSNKFITNKVQGILVNLASRELQHIKNNPDYIRLQKYLILQKLNTITNHILIKQLIDFSINRNIHSKDSLSYIQDRKFHLKSKNTQMLLYIISTNVLVGLPVHAYEVKANLRNIIANRRMPYQQLIKIQPEVKQGLDHLCSSQNLDYIYTAVLMFAFPTMPDNYQLTILTPLLKTLNKKHKFHYSNSLYYLTLPHLLQLSLTIPNASQLVAPTANNIKNVTQFHDEMKRMLSRTIAFLTKQKQMYGNMAQLHIDIHITILQLCIRYSLLNLVYLEELVRMCARATGALKTRISVGHLLEICGLVGKLAVIRDSQIFNRLENEDGAFPPDICRKYLNELIFANESVLNQQRYLQKILKRNSKLAPLMISYIKNRIAPLRPLLQILPIDNSLTIGSKCPTLDILVKYKIIQQQALTKCQQKDHRVELTQLQQNCRLIKTVTKENITKYYSVLSGPSLQLQSATTLYMIYMMIAQLGSCRIQHVFLCCDDAAAVDCLKNGGIQGFEAMYCLENTCKFIQSKQK